MTDNHLQGASRLNFPYAPGVVEAGIVLYRHLPEVAVLCRVRDYAERGFDDTVVSLMVSKDLRIFSSLSLGIVFGVF
jgi:hypothetical protein